MITPYDTTLPPELRELKEKIEGHARDYGLDFYETIFEVIDADDLNEIAAYGGFPTRYPHWSFGMSYEELKKGYDYGLSKIYEMVINNDPCYAYLMRCNHTLDQKLVMAHVYGHSDFFKNNAYFAHTNRKMMDEMANHGARIRSFVDKYGEDEVERFMDRCMSIDDLIDIHSTAIRRRPVRNHSVMSSGRDDHESPKGTRFKAKDYMDEHINPRRLLQQEEDERRKAQQQQERRYPEQPEKDVLLFLIENAPLKNWQREILSIIRDEAYYFMPQAQTKIMNEGWACLTEGARVFTENGLLKIEDIVQQQFTGNVSDGEKSQHIYDHAQFTNREIIYARTRRGFEIEGSVTHRVLQPNGEWKRLDELHIGDEVELGGGQNCWAEDYVALEWNSPHRLTLLEIAEEVGCDVETVIRHRSGVRGKYATTLAPLVEQYETDCATLSFMQNKRQDIKLPSFIDERLGAILGYLVGDGHISHTKPTLGLTTGDEEQAEHFAWLMTETFDIPVRTVNDGRRWQVRISFQQLQDVLVHLGLKTGVAARIKQVPEVILQSPKSVVSAFLRAYFDSDGYAGDCGIILSTFSDDLAEMTQLLLLNYGILSRRRKTKDGGWHVHITGKSASIFSEEIGFQLHRKQDALEAYLDGHQWFKQESWNDEIVSIEHRDQADVYDISVENTHRYAAQGFINHNSYWHSTIMTQKALLPSEVIDYADHHSGTMAMSGGRLNPYKIGIELFRDIEERWNTGRFGKEYEECDDLDKKRKWNKDLGLGRQKIFDVRKIYNDITFIDTFLTPEFCVQHKLFSFAYQDQAGVYYIDSRDFEAIKQKLLSSLTNFGKPWIYVVDANHDNRGELMLNHEFHGAELRLDHAAETLVNIQYIWGRPVHLQTIVDDKPTILTFDGREHDIKTGGEIDDDSGNSEE